jgi:hypothetical protein
MDFLRKIRPLWRFFHSDFCYITYNVIRWIIYDKLVNERDFYINSKSFLELAERRN